MRDFVKYNSLSLIRESRENELDTYRAACGDRRCVVMEKVHGANFEVATDGSEVRYASRNLVLGEGADFYGYQYVTDVLSKRILEMFKDMKEMVMAQHEACDHLEGQGEPCNRPDIPRDFQQLSIRGELAGGQYPAEGVAKVKVGHGQVGNGSIWYSQDKSFYAFEICIDDVPQDFYTLATLCPSFGIPVAPVLHFGTFQECLEWSKGHLEDNTLIPTMQPALDEEGKPVMEGDYFTNLPTIEGNTREGHVISPVEPAWLPNGKRMIFKHKGDKFMENKGSKKAKAKVQVVFTEDQQAIFDAVLPLLTEQRLEAVQSKEPMFEPKNFQKACGLVISDALDELLNFNDGYSLIRAAWDKLNTKERKQVTKQLGFECTSRLREVFFK